MIDSDISWVSLVNPKFDVIFAPYETYLDDFLGVKTSYGAAVLVRVIDSLRQAGIEKILTVVGPYVPELVPLALGAGSEVLLLEEQTKGMRGSVEQPRRH